MATTAAEKKWTKVLTRYGKTKLSTKQFCEQQGISYAQLHYWRNKLEDAPEQPKEPFVPIVLPSKEAPIPAPTIELLLPGGVTLRMTGVTNAQR